MNSQEQSFYAFGLLYARILKNRKELAWAERIATEYADKMRLPAVSSGMTETGRGVSGSPGGKSVVAAGAGAPPSSSVKPATMEELGTLMEELGQEKRELQGEVELREELILDEYEKMLSGVPGRSSF